jgi:hypothetical protein
MENQILEIGKIYDVASQRKGHFTIQLKNQCETWAHGFIIKGTAKAILSYNVVYEGEEISLRKSLTYFKEKN